MKKGLLGILLCVALNCNAQFLSKSLDRRYFYHWESIYPLQSDMEIIIHKESGKPRVTEISFDHNRKLGTGIIMSTVYVCMNKKGRMIVETVNPSTLEIIQSEYILTRDKKLLRIVNKDTITFQRRYSNN